MTKEKATKSWSDFIYIGSQIIYVYIYICISITASCGNCFQDTELDAILKVHYIREL